MKKYTQAEFDALERDEFGRKSCPTGDYSAIERFDKGGAASERDADSERYADSAGGAAVKD